MNIFLFVTSMTHPCFIANQLRHSSYPNSSKRKILIPVPSGTAVESFDTKTKTKEDLRNILKMLEKSSSNHSLVPGQCLGMCSASLGDGHSGVVIPVKT